MDADILNIIIELKRERKKLIERLTEIDKRLGSVRRLIGAKKTPKKRQKVAESIWRLRIKETLAERPMSAKELSLKLGNTTVTVIVSFMHRDGEIFRRRAEYVDGKGLSPFIYALSEEVLDDVLSVIKGVDSDATASDIRSTAGHGFMPPVAVFHGKPSMLKATASTDNRKRYKRRYDGL